MRRLPVRQWLSALMDRDNRLDVHPRFFGEAVRHDGWSCRGRSEPWHFVYVALEGRSVGRTSRDGRDITMEPGQALWLPPHVVHDFTWTPTFRYDEVWFRITDRRGRDLSPVREPLKVDGAAELRSLFERLTDELRFIDRPMREQSLRCLIATLSVTLLRLSESTRATRRGLTPSQRERLSRYTQRHLGHALTPADLARELDLSHDYFTRQFRISFGCSPRTWLTRERARAASRLLSNSDLRVFQIAEQLGYADVPQFSRQFRAVMGISAQQYRETVHAREAVDRTA